MNNGLTEKFITNAKGEKLGVVLSYHQYQKLLEDLHDLAVVAERRNEKTFSLADMKKKLKKDELV